MNYVIIYAQKRAQSYSWIFTNMTVIWKSKGGCVTITFPESETVDHPRKHEEKTQNTDNHNTNKLEPPTQLERTITTPQFD